MSGNISLGWGKIKMLFLSFELSRAIVNEPPILIILELIHEHFLILLMPLITKQQDPPKRIQNPTLLIIIINAKILRHNRRNERAHILINLQTNTRIERPLQNGIDQLLVVDENLVVDADLVEEAGGADLLVQVLQDVGDVTHQDVLGFHVVEAQ
jgi:hypothetical protein